MKYIIFGGAFDPPHTAHIAVARKALDVTGYDKVLFMPTYKNMFGKKMSNPIDRLRMTEITLHNFGETKRMGVLDFEVIYELKGSTFEIIRLFKEVDPIARHYIAYMIGSDQAKMIDKWVRWEDLTKMIPFIVVTRSMDEKIPKFFYQKPHQVVVTPIDVLMFITVWSR